MSNNERTLDWLISTHGEFLQQFGIDDDKIVTEYNHWENRTSDNSILNYFIELLRQASSYIIKNSPTEEEFYNSKLLLDSKMFEYGLSMEKESKNYLLSQIHFDKLMISRLTLPFKFYIQIDASNCCSHCAKKDKQVYAFENVLEKKYLPFAKCKREEGCCCSYSTVPLHDENAKLISRDI